MKTTKQQIIAIIHKVMPGSRAILSEKSGSKAIANHIQAILSPAWIGTYAKEMTAQELEILKGY